MMRGLPLMLMLALAAVLPAVAQVRVHVTVERAVLRYQNAEDAEAAGEVTTGQVLTASSPLDGAWVSVEPPQGVFFWIYAELVRNGCVAADKAQIRSGAGLSSRVVASADRDMPVEVCGRLGDWIRIRPLPGLPVWIKRSQIAAAPADAPADAIALPSAVATGLLAALNAPPVAATTTDAVPAAAAVSTNGAVARGAPHPVLPPELAGMTPTGEPAQGRRVRFHGLLRRTLTGASQTPAAYRLAGPDRSGGIVTFCHVLGADALFAPHVGSPVIVTGSVWWLVGESVPIILVDRLVEEQPQVPESKKP